MRRTARHAKVLEETPRATTKDADAENSRMKQAVLEYHMMVEQIRIGFGEELKPARSIEVMASEDSRALRGSFANYESVFIGERDADR